MISSVEQPKMHENKLIPIEKFGMKFMSFGFINNENSPTIWRGPMVSSCLLYTSPSPRDRTRSRMPSSA